LSGRLRSFARPFRRSPTAGAVELIDYKSGPATSPEQAASSLQLWIYALACRDALGLSRPDRVTLYCVARAAASAPSAPSPPWTPCAPT
jgi:RecB family exonuclease